MTAQPVRELQLVVDAAHRLHRRLHHLSSSVGVGRVLGRNGLTEHLGVLRHELLVARGVRVGRVAHGVHDALGVLLTDRLDVLVGERRRAGLVEHLRGPAGLQHRAGQPDAVLERRAVHDQVGVGRLHGRDDAVEVLGVDRVGRLVDGLDAGGLEDLADPLDVRRRERVVQGRVRRGLRPLVRREVLHPVGEDQTLLVRGGLLGEEEVLVAAVEHVGRAARGLDVQHPVLLRDRRRREVEQRGEGAEQQVDVVLADQSVVVRDDGVLVGRVVLDGQLDLLAEQPAVGVGQGLPDLVPLLGRRARLREVARQGEGRADRQVAAAVAAAAAARVAAGGQPQGHRSDEGHGLPAVADGDVGHASSSIEPQSIAVAPVL